MDKGGYAHPNIQMHLVFRNQISVRIRFYVPEGTQKIGLNSTGVIPIRVMDTGGNEVLVYGNEEGRNLFLVEVPSGDDGECWSFQGFEGREGFRILNGPSVFAWSEEGMMVPEELRQQR